MVKTPRGRSAVSSIYRHLDLIVEPTIADLQKDQLSVRKTFTACLVTFHAIDRFAEKPGNLRKEWRDQSQAFALIDLIAHTFKHVDAEGGKEPKPGRIPWKAAMPGAMGLNTHALNESGPDVRQIFFLVNEAAKFIRRKADQLALASERD
mgnify:CR=1 FL=1